MSSNGFPKMVLGSEPCEGLGFGGGGAGFGGGAVCCGGGGGGCCW